MIGPCFPAMFITPLLSYVLFRRGLSVAGASPFVPCTSQLDCSRIVYRCTSFPVHTRGILFPSLPLLTVSAQSKSSCPNVRLLDSQRCLSSGEVGSNVRPWPGAMYLGVFTASCGVNMYYMTPRDLLVGPCRHPPTTPTHPPRV
jgi:hypothetical protein